MERKGEPRQAGRLSVTFPASDTQGPAPATQLQHYPGVNGLVSYDEGLDVGYRWYDARDDPSNRLLDRLS